MRTVRLLVILATGLPLWLAGCGGEPLPHSLPTTQILKRFAPRANLVELVISDRQRAAKVRSLYIELEEVFIADARDGAKGFKKLATPVDEPLSDEALRQLMAKRAAQMRSSFKKYISIQVELRKHMTPGEFARLDGIR